MRLPPDDILERAPEDPLPEDEPRRPAFAWAPFPVEFGGTWWLDPAEGAAPEPEPALVFAWAPFPVEFGPSFWADPARPAEAEEPPPVRRRMPRLGLAGSLCVHLLPLLLLIGDTGAPSAAAGAIPVRLVIEQPAVESPTEAAAQPEPLLPPAPPAAQAAAPLAPPRLKPTPPKPSHAPVAASEPKPIPPAPNPPLPKPVPVAMPAPRPPSARPAVAEAIAPSPAPVKETAPAATVQPAAAPAAATAEDNGSYLDYLVTLTRRHSDMLPPSFLAGRHGETVLTVVVHDDGTVLRIGIKHSSGYPDIDQRIEQMVMAVGRFPPVPDSFRKPSVDLDFNLAFPDALQQ